MNLENGSIGWWNCFSDADEFIYDEMVTHVPMAVHPNAKKILIIGGGDGGVAKELIKYPFVEKIDVVETDKMFVDVCRKFSRRWHVG